MVWHQHQIIKPDQDGLSSISFQIEMNMTPVTIRCIVRRERVALNHLIEHISPAEPNTEVRRKYLEIRKQRFLARNYAASGWK
jgi:hypothetical protein